MDIEFLDQSFATKAAFERWLRARVAALPLKVELTGRDHELAWAILERRRSRVEKIGPGVDAFWVAPDFGSGRSFRLRRVDGTIDSFSWRKAVAEGTQLSFVTAALRVAVWPEIKGFRRAAFERGGPVLCALTGEVLTEETCEVDHVTEFWKLRDRWVEGVGGLDAVQVTTVTGDVRAKAVLADPEQLASWLAFHQEHAELRLTTAKANRERWVA